MKMKKNLVQHIWDLVGFPLRAFLLDEKWQYRLHLTTLKSERMGMVANYIKGRVLDIGCGTNDLILWYRQLGGYGVGVDVFNFGGADLIVDTVRLPFRNNEFDCVCFIANLNHIPKSKREAVIAEARRVLRENGDLIITMIDPLIGWLAHKLTWWDPDQKARKIDWNEEDYGLSYRYIVNIMRKHGFRLVYHKKFLYNLNNLFLFRKISDFGNCA